VSTANTLRLRAVVGLFRLSASQIARGTGFSRPYVSRCLSGENLIPSPEFLRKLERQRGTIIDGRTSQFFTIPAVPVARARNVIEQLPTDEVAAVSQADQAAYPGWSARTSKLGSKFKALSCSFRLSRTERGCSGIFRGMSALSNIELTAGRRRARQQATAKSFGRKLRRMGIRGEPVPPCGRPEGFSRAWRPRGLRMFTVIYGYIRQPRRDRGGGGEGHGGCSVAARQRGPTNDAEGTDEPAARPSRQSGDKSPHSIWRGRRRHREHGGRRSAVGTDLLADPPRAIRPVGRHSRFSGEVE
jgi:transcriptional regulator with XRE-family HTH domain